MLIKQKNKSEVYRYVAQCWYQAINWNYDFYHISQQVVIPVIKIILGKSSVATSITSRLNKDISKYTNTSDDRET